MNLFPQNGDIFVLGVLDNSGYGTNFPPKHNIKHTTNRYCKNQL
jgi:hypothetical protein